MRDRNGELSELFERVGHLLAHVYESALLAGGSPQLIALRLARDHARNKLMKQAAYVGELAKAQYELLCATRELRMATEAAEAFRHRRH